MGGKNKYLINGINVQNKRVSDLFCSVQLNVNNPHFLIMQGRITKVLNMKPPEVIDYDTDMDSWLPLKLDSGLCTILQ